MQSQHASATSEGGGRDPFTIIIHFHKFQSTVSPQNIFGKQLRREVEYHHAGHRAIGRAEGMVPVSTGSSDLAEPAVHRGLAGKEINSATGSDRLIAASIRPEQAISSAYVTEF